MNILNTIFNSLKTIQKVFKIKDIIAVSLFSGFLGTMVMDASNYVIWKNKKTEVLYGHIAGSIFVHPIRTNQRKNFWLGQLTHLITGAYLAYPLNLLMKKTGKDHAKLKGAFFGVFAWESIYWVGQRVGVFMVKPRKTKTYYSALFNNILYGVVTSQALITFSEPSAFPDTQRKTTAQYTPKNIVQPIYSDTNYNVENSDAYRSN